MSRDGFSILKACSYIFYLKWVFESLFVVCCFKNSQEKKNVTKGKRQSRKPESPEEKTSLQVMRRTKKVRNQTKVQRAGKQSKGGKAVLVVHSFSCGVESQLHEVTLWLLFLYFPQRRRHAAPDRRRRHAETWTGHELTVARTVPITETSLVDV